MLITIFVSWLLREILAEDSVALKMYRSFTTILPIFDTFMLCMIVSPLLFEHILCGHPEVEQLGVMAACHFYK